MAANDGVGRRRGWLMTAIEICRLLSLVGALLIWVAWSATVFWLLLGFALLAGSASVVLARVAIRIGTPVATACDLDSSAPE